ncbi:MAG: hypothetical protein COC17_06115 [Hyphomicrobiales bacterium]|nr:hypothetical protein [Hyphomicrobiales bacterium]PCH50143.1 MAG: hypothetical protein COC17_06115 [Hyphomicrobiales bacterium]
MDIRHSLPDQSWLGSAVTARTGRFWRGYYAPRQVTLSQRNYIEVVWIGKAYFLGGGVDEIGAVFDG